MFVSELPPFDCTEFPKSVPEKRKSASTSSFFPQAKATLDSLQNIHPSMADTSRTGTQDRENVNGHQRETNEDDGLAPSAASQAIDDLITRAKVILSELESFKNRLRELRLEGTVEIAHFRSTAQSELAMLERLSAKPENESTTHVARSSNLPFLETVWSTTKKSKDIVALLKRVYIDSNSKTAAEGARHIGNVRGYKEIKRKSDGAVIVDAITNGGRTWTKVSLITNTRLLFDLAKQGWEAGGSSDEEDFDKASDDDHDVPLLKTAKDLTRAATFFRIRTKHPKVVLILPRIRPNETTEIDDILEDCRSCGAEVFCGEDLQPLPDFESAMKTMTPDPMSGFSSTLNIDCTILLALVSDFSHVKVTKEPWFHTALQRQVEIEDSENLLPALLYPALGNRKMVCTAEAAHRMREIVSTIGTPGEKARTAILMGDDTSKSQQQLVADVQEWSTYSVPSDWQLPISVVHRNENEHQGMLPPQAKSVCESMTAINQSVFLYGWASSQTTITSNRTVVKQIENDLEKFDDLDESVWPQIWLCPTARSLVGKEKRGSKKSVQKQATAMS